MEAIIFCGIQGAGKTTFCRERLFETHLRLSLDLLKTRRRESILVAACLEAKQPFVIDDTNPTRADRARYIGPARGAGFRVTGYFFAADPRVAFERNRRRPGRAAIPAAGLFATHRRFEVPRPDEGFDALYRVELVEGAGFIITPWPWRASTRASGPAQGS